MPTESAVARVQRFLVLLPWLKAHPGVTIKEAAAHFGITTSQLVQDLRDLGSTELPGMHPGESINIEFWSPDSAEDDTDVHVDDDCTIVVIESLQFDRPTRIAAAEAARLVLALDVLETMVGSGFTAIPTARAKLTTIGPGETVPGQFLPRGKAPSRSAVVATVMQSLATGHCLTIDYLSGGRDEVSTRIIEPLELIVEAGGLERVDAWCRQAEGVRSFRVDRILRADLSDEEPRRPDVLDRAGVLQDSAALRVHVTGPASSAWAIDGLPGCVVQSPAGAPIIASFPAGSMEWAVRWALSHADVLTVTGPEDLVAHIRSRARDALES